jgi:xanthosine utilization system XapX-like protein
MTSGLDEFKDLLSEFNKLSLAVVGAGVVVPFAAALAVLSPPWPPGIVILTAIGDLVGLVLVFQYLRHSSRRTVNRAIAWSATALLITVVAYLAALSEFTTTTPTDNPTRIVFGYECTEQAQRFYGDRCVAPRLAQLAEARFESDAFWTRRSITVVRIGLTVGWLATFFSLTVLLGTFLVYQSRQRKRTSAKT